MDTKYFIHQELMIESVKKRPDSFRKIEVVVGHYEGLSYRVDEAKVDPFLHG